MTSTSASKKASPAPKKGPSGKKRSQEGKSGATSVVEVDDPFVAGEIKRWTSIYPIVNEKTRCTGCPRLLGKMPMVCPCRKAYFCIKCRSKRTKDHLLCKPERMPSIVVTPPLEEIPPPHIGELTMGKELGSVSIPVQLIAHQYLPRMGKRGSAYYLENGVIVLQVADNTTPALVQLPKSAPFLAEQAALLRQTEAHLRRTSLIRQLILQALTKADKPHAYGSVPATVPGIWSYDAYCEKRLFAVSLRGPEYRQVLPIFHPRGEADLVAFQEHARAQVKYAQERQVHLVELSTEDEHPIQVVLKALTEHVARTKAMEDQLSDDDVDETKGDSKAAKAKEQAKEETKELDPTDEGYEEGAAAGDRALMDDPIAAEGGEGDEGDEPEREPTEEEKAERARLAQFATEQLTALKAGSVLA